MTGMVRPEPGTLIRRASDWIAEPSMVRARISCDTSAGRKSDTLVVPREMSTTRVVLSAQGVLEELGERVRGGLGATARSALCRVGLGRAGRARLLRECADTRRERLDGFRAAVLRAGEDVGRDAGLACDLCAGR